MELIDVVRSQQGSIVVIDDDFSPPNFDGISGEALTAQFQLLARDPEAKKSLAALLDRSDSEEAGALAKLAQENASSFWDRYLADPAQLPFLTPLLADLRSNYLSSRARTAALVAFLKTHFGIDPLTFPSLEQAKPHMKSCVLAFVDFFIGVDNEADAIAKHAELRTELQEPLNYNDQNWPKLIFLVSSRLPQQKGLDAFRAATGIKSAFFLAIDKKDIEDAFMSRAIGRCLERYVSATQLNTYLVSIEKAINGAANSLIEDVSKLELHDLTALKTLRLDAESESLQSYLTWLLSEALGVKLRSASGLRDELLPKEGAFIPLDGQLLPRSVLFELFSEIAVAPVTTGANQLIVFGDILEEIPTHHPGQRSLLLVIAPACDLIRCDSLYEVMCVRGNLDAEGADLSTLLDRNYKFGKGHLVLRHITEGAPLYSRITWDEKRICTVPHPLLKDPAKYKRVARLSEVFAQEVKELALASVARVGTPVDPSFSVALHCMVRLKLSMGNGEEPLAMQTDLSDRDYVCAIMAMGRDAGAEGSDVTKTLIFSHQFQDWLVSEFLSPAIQKAGTFATKLEKAKALFENPSNLRVALTTNTTKLCDGFVQVISRDAAPTDEQTKQGLEICLFPFQQK